MTDKNNNKNIIIYEKELNVDYVFKNSIENEVHINCNNVNIQISQHDISFLLLCIKLPEKKQDEPLQKYKSTMPYLKSDNKLNKVDNKDLLGFAELKSQPKDKSEKYLPRMSMEEYQNETRKKFSLGININIPKLNLCFCMNDHSKQSEFIIESSKIKLQSILYENVFEKKTFNELEYSILLHKLIIHFLLILIL